MQGYQLTFFTQQDRMHGTEPLSQWLLSEAKRIGLRGATISGSLQGLGHDGVTHATGWFDQSDQPVQVTLIVTNEECERLLDCIERAHIRIFYVKLPAEFGYAGMQ